MAKKVKSSASEGRVLNARWDSIDIRDRMYMPTLVEVPAERPLADYRKAKVPMLDQGREGACTGYGLATVVNYLLRTRKKSPKRTTVSADMLYHLAWRCDEWHGENKYPPAKPGVYLEEFIAAFSEAMDSAYIETSICKRFRINGRRQERLTSTGDTSAR